MAKSRKSKVIVPLMLDFGAGENCQPGYEGVDLYAPSAKHKVDLFKLPLPWKDGTVDGIWCSHFVEHIPQHLRWTFFEECWRIMKLEGVMRIFVPSWKSERAYGDMTHQWPPVTTMFFFYLNRDWRKVNKLEHGAYDLKCNFDFQSGPTGINPAWADRTREAQEFAATHYLEVYPDLWATLTKKA